MLVHIWSFVQLHSFKNHPLCYLFICILRLHQVNPISNCHTTKITLIAQVWKKNLLLYKCTDSVQNFDNAIEKKIRQKSPRTWGLLHIGLGQFLNTSAKMAGVQDVMYRQSQIYKFLRLDRWGVLYSHIWTNSVMKHVFFFEI